ncbi:MFS transporter [Clostridiaceae bacterium M8S5]|nr:MFS transporter [Clostridiaceae bacterium M8S5]
MLINTRELKNNVKKNYLYTFLSSFNLTGGIWMLYLAFKGLNLMEIGIMESIYHITSFTMEIPTGVIADIYGRKTSRVLSSVARVISVVIMLIGNNVYYFALSFIITAIGNNLESGAGDALIYDSLKEINEENTYMKISGKKEIFYQASSSIALVVGGYLGTISYNYVYMLALAFAVITLLQSLTFTEPTIGKIQKSDSRFKTFLDQVMKSIRVIKSDSRIAFLIITAEIYSTFVTTEFFYIQNYFKGLGRNELNIGIILSISALTAAFAATKAHKIEKRFGFRGILTVMPLLGILSLWGITIIRITEISFVCLIAVESILYVVISDYINRLIPSEQRATILSFQSMAFSLFMILLFPLIGKLGDQYSLIYAFKIIAIVASVVLFIIIMIVNLNTKITIDKR